MCGIAGIIHPNQESVQRAVSAMNRAQAHRGPDDEGAVVFPASGSWVGLGHRRLAIIDVSPAGHQPMQDPDNGNWITFNGEIYNFQKIRRELEARDEIFRTATDTEVILKAYRVWGTECVKQLHGIFAFGLWDASRRCLLLARDQLGVKPLYIFRKGETLLFASEVRAILATGLVPRSLDHDGLLSYLSYGSLQHPFTLVQDVRSLPAGHYAEWRDGVLKASVRYWQLPSFEAIVPHAQEQMDDVISHELAEVVGSQLISDVPVGSFLSGGIDSTAIASLMRLADRGVVKTFSIVFNEATYDERQWSRLAARYIGTDHTELLLTGEEVRRQLPVALEAFDQPSIDGLNTYFVSKAVREAGLTVALSGVGGDELFGGYDGYNKILTAERCQPLRRFLPTAVRSALADLLGSYDHSEAMRKVADFLVATRHSYFITRRLFSDRQMNWLLARDIPRSSAWQQEAFDAIEREAQGYDTVNRASAFELQTYMMSTLLRDTDQMSMAHALEVRVPLIDHRLVELLFTVPGTYKLDKKLPKPLLTRPLAGLLPHDCVHRPKRGFELPFQVWFKEALETQIRDSLCGSASRITDWPLSSHALNALWNKFQAGHVNWGRVWSIFVLKLWMERHHIIG
jgi:asparagine synthase (glutamine-hydrolysing)